MQPMMQPRALRQTDGTGAFGGGVIGGVSGADGMSNGDLADLLDANSSPAGMVTSISGATDASVPFQTISMLDVAPAAPLSAPAPAPSASDAAQSHAAAASGLESHRVSISPPLAGLLPAGSIYQSMDGGGSGMGGAPDAAITAGNHSWHSALSAASSGLVGVPPQPPRPLIHGQGGGL